MVFVCSLCVDTQAFTSSFFALQLNTFTMGLSEFDNYQAAKARITKQMGALTQDQNFARTDVPLRDSHVPHDPHPVAGAWHKEDDAFPPYSSQTAGTGGIKGHQHTMGRVAFPCPAHCCLEQNFAIIQLPGDGMWSSWSSAGRHWVNITHPGTALRLPWKLGMAKVGSPTATRIPWPGLLAKGMELSRGFPILPWPLFPSLPGLSHLCL